MSLGPAAAGATGITGIARGAILGFSCAETSNTFAKIIARDKAAEHRRTLKRVRNFRAPFALASWSARAAAPLSILSANWKCSFLLKTCVFMQSVVFAGAFVRKSRAADQRVRWRVQPAIRWSSSATDKTSSKV